METRNIPKEVTMKILALLDKVVSGDVEYWLPLTGLAYNPASKHTYTSINQLLLSFVMSEMRYPCNNWLTFKQIKDAGGSVLKSEKSTSVTFSQVIYLNDKNEKITPEEAKQVFLKAKEEHPTIYSYREAGITTKRFLRYYLVFNVAQTKGLPDTFSSKSQEPLLEIERDEQAEELLLEHEVNYVHAVGDSAHYDILNDIIYLPFTKQFKTSETYYATLFHELIHWTGHEKRLQRTFGISDSPEYAFEELVAELGSAFLCAHFQIPASLTSTTAYIKSWLTALQNDHNYILKALGLAEKAMDFLLEKHHKEVQMVAD